MRSAWWVFCLVVILVWIPAFAGMTGGVKYDPHFGNAWEAAIRQKAPRRWLDCVIRLSHPPAPQDLDQLKAAGFKSRSVIDTIVTGRIQVRRVQQLIDLPLVVSIEGGGFGGAKRTQGMK